MAQFDLGGLDTNGRATIFDRRVECDVRSDRLIEIPDRFQKVVLVDAFHPVRKFLERVRDVTRRMAHAVLVWKEACRALIEHLPCDPRRCCKETFLGVGAEIRILDFLRRQVGHERLQVFDAAVRNPKRPARVRRASPAALLRRPL